MKKALLFLCVIASFAAHAAVINVSNSPSAPVNPPYTYSSLQTAINAAADGDSLYVSGTNIDYGATVITNKTLTLIGAGYGNNLQSNFQQKTYIYNIAFAGFNGVKNVVLVGIYFQEDITTQSGGAVNNLLIDRCSMHNLNCESNNLIMRQCLMETGCDGNTIFRPTVNSNAIIQNSVFAGNISGGSVNTALWENNIFKQSDCGVGQIGTYNGSATFNNNIFNNGYSVNVVNCSFNNNLFVSLSSLGNGNVDNGSIFTTSASFVNNASPAAAIGRANYCTVVDYHLAAGSAAIGTGLNGTDMGIYGGTNPMPATATLNGVPAMPRITEMNVQNVSVAPNGNLNVQIKAVKQN